MFQSSSLINSILSLHNIVNGQSFVIRTILTVIYKLVIKMSDNEYELRRISTNHFRQLVDEALADNEFLGDKENCALVSDKLAKMENTGVWMEFRRQLGNPTKRRLHCIPHASVEGRAVLVKEDAYFNICKSLDVNEKQDTCKIHCSLLTKEFLPKLAVTARVAPINMSWDFSAEDVDELLSTYFEVPKFLYVDDVFSVPLSICHSLAKAASYNQVIDIYFKVVSGSTCEDTEDSSNTEDGFYVLKKFSNLFCVTPMSAFLPPRSWQIVCKNGQTISRVPPDLEKNVEELKKLVGIFTTVRKPECLPLFLMTGSPGSGKMNSLQLTAELLGVNLITISAYDISNLGISALEAKLDVIFQSALKRAPCILAFTMLEIIGKDKNGNEDPAVVTIVLQKITTSLSRKNQFPVIVVGVADCKVENIVPSLSRAFVHFIKFQPTSPAIAIATLDWIAASKGFNILTDVLSVFSSKITGYAHGDLELLIKIAIRLLLEDKIKDKILRKEHLEKAIELMEEAYSDSIGAAKVPNVRWDDIGGLSALKEEIMLTLNTPLQRPNLLAGGLRRSGILLYGPPGTGKTLMAKAVATECAMNFLSVKGPELMNMYVGQSERNVREVFSRGREAAPCILFFDELDSLAPNRGKNGDSGGVTDRVVSQILAEMDGLQSNRGLFVIAATNRPDLVDPALLRPGRFDKMFYLGPCTDTESKLSVLQALTNKFVLSKTVDLKTIAENLPEQVTGADIYSVCSNAWLAAARRGIRQIELGNNPDVPLEVDDSDFLEGIAEMVPSLTPSDLKYYDQMASSAR